MLVSRKCSNSHRVDILKTSRSSVLLEDNEDLPFTRPTLCVQLKQATVGFDFVLAATLPRRWRWPMIYFKSAPQITSSILPPSMSEAIAYPDKSVEPGCWSCLSYGSCYCFKNVLLMANGNRRPLVPSFLHRRAFMRRTWHQRCLRVSLPPGSNTKTFLQSTPPGRLVWLQRGCIVGTLRC